MVTMATIFDSGSSDEEFEGFPCQGNHLATAMQRNGKLLDKSLESTEEEEEDDSDGFKGAIKSSGRKRKEVEAFESDEDDSGSEEDDASSDDEEINDGGGDDDDEEEDSIEDSLDVDLNEDNDVPSNSDQCPICLMSLGGQTLGTPSECQHVFCLACIMEWSKNANTCPVDRKIFHQILVHSTKKGPILERIPVEDRRVPEVRWEQEPTFCEVCNECDREDRMLLCDGCDKGYHLECLTPRLYTVPAGSWYCGTCIQIRRNERMEEEGESLPELLPGNVRRSRGTARVSTRSEISSESSSEIDVPERARTAATGRRTTPTRGRGRGRGRTGSRPSTRGRSRSRTTGRSRTGSSARRGRGGKKKTSKRTSSTTGKSKRKKRKTSTSKRKRKTTTKPKAKKRKVDKEGSYLNPFDGHSFRGRTPRERISNSLRASSSTSDGGRGLGMSSRLSIFGDQFALDGFEDDSTNEPEQSDSASSVRSGNSDVLGSIFDGIETLHDQNAMVSRDGRVLPSESPDKQRTNKERQVKAAEGSTNHNPSNLSREGSSDVISPPCGNKPSNGAKSIARDQNNSHVTLLKVREGERSQRNDRSRDDGARDPAGHRAGTSGSPTLVKYDKQTTPGRKTEQIEKRTEKSTFTRNNSSTATTYRYTSTPPPKLKIELSSKLPPSAQGHFFSGCPSKLSSLQQTTSPSSEKRVRFVRFKIPKMSSKSTDFSSTRELPSPGTVPNDSSSSKDFKLSHSDNSVSETPPGDSPSKSCSFQDPKLSPSSSIADSPESKTPFPNSDDSSIYEKASPDLWTENDPESKKLPEFVVDDNARKTPTNVPEHNNLDSLEDKKISLNNAHKMDSTSFLLNMEQKPENLFKLQEAKSDFRSVHKDDTSRSAFSPVSKTRKNKSPESSDRKSNETGETKVQNPSSFSKPSLQQLPTGLRSSSPSSKTLGSRPSISSLSGSSSTGLSRKAKIRRSLSPLSKLLGPRPSTTGMTGFSSISLSEKTLKQSPAGQDNRVIEFSREKGELKIRVVSSQDEAHPTLRSLPPSSSTDSPLPPLNAVQPLSSLRPLKYVPRQPTRPRLKMLSTPETTSGNLTCGVLSSRDFPNRTNQNLAIIQMLRHKTSSLRSEVEKGHLLLREELESSRMREMAENEPESLSQSSSSSTGSSIRPPIEGLLDQHENNANRPKLSSLLGLPRNLNVPVAVVRPSPSSVIKNTDPGLQQSVSVSGAAESDANEPQDMESERERNRKKGIARLQRIERIKDVVKAALQPYYNHNEITRQDFKEIFIRAVDKVKDSKHEVERHRIAALVKKYVKMFKGLRLIATNRESDL